MIEKFKVHKTHELPHSLQVIIHKEKRVREREFLRKFHLNVVKYNHCQYYD
jgi:phosphoribosylaminoimidazole carboxylase (NCAIR synthetase)